MNHPEYEPLDLAAACNADQAGPAWGNPIAPGTQTFHGLPFSFAGTGERARVLVAGGTAPRAAVTIPVGKPAHHVIFVHRLLESNIPAGAPAGERCADYVVTLADDREVVLPVRDRLEIGMVPIGWGQWPIVATPDRQDGLQSRWQGHWGGSGYRQTEATQGWAQRFYLWSWANPTPEVEIKSIQIRPAGLPFALGAITLSHLPEPPITRAAKKAVKIVLPQSADAAKPFDVKVEVDRGVANYPYALPTATAAGFLADPMPGWGEPQNPGSSPVWVEVAANPSATVTVKQGDETLGSARWGDLQRDGRAKPNDRLELIVVEPGRNWAKTTVVDADTGKPVPCRVHFRSADGIPYQPHGHHTHVNSNLDTWHVDIGGDLRLDQVTYAYINGTCEGWLPRGEVLVDIARGYEYVPIRQRVTVAPGQRELTFALKRLRNLELDRWFSGDTHVHFLSTRGGHREAAGEGLQVVNLLLSQWGHLFTNTEEFTGRPDVDSANGTIVYATQENRQHILGHLSLLGLKEPVNPWCTDGPSEAELGGNLESTLSHWADACRAQGGTVVIPHLPNPNCEPATLIATGRADAVEMLVYDEYFQREYYRYLNCGYRLPLTGGTDKMTADVPVGLYRTYVRIPEHEPFTYDNWCKALRSGATFLSGGPLIGLTVEGRPIGATINVPKGGGTVEVAAWAESILPISSLELVMNGEVVARTEQKSGAGSLTLKHKIKVNRHSWIAARCARPGSDAPLHHDGWHRGIFAHTSPVYLAVGEPWWMFDKATADYMLTLMHGGLEYIRTKSRQWEPGTVTHHHGKDDHLAFLEAPFRQAIEAIHKRLHDHNIPH